MSNASTNMMDVAMTDHMARDYGIQLGGSQMADTKSGTAYHAQFTNAPRVAWNDLELKRITRLRLLSDPGYPTWDISYCHGVMKDGTLCHVQLPMVDLPYSRNGKRMWAILYTWGTRDGVNVNRLFAGCDISTLR